MPKTTDVCRKCGHTYMTHNRACTLCTCKGFVSHALYNGFANRDSFMFDVVWANDQPVYNAILSEAERLLKRLPTMTDQTLGLNCLNSVRAAVHRGGWGYSDVPEGFGDVPRKSWTDLAATCNLMKVNEEEFGAQIRDALSGRGYDPRA